MNPLRLAGVALILASSALAGCLFPSEELPPEPYAAFGGDGRWVLGWSYDGKDARDFKGDITIDVLEETNSGNITGSVAYLGVPLRVDFHRFAEQPNKTFQNGGIVRHIEEHGDTGMGDTSIPRVQADLAAWGFAALKLNGTALPDQVTGAPEWAAHVMVLDTGVRDNGTNAIYTDASKSTPYDPANPARGFAETNDTEIHLVLRSQAPPPPATNTTVIENPEPITAVAEDYRRTELLHDNKFWGTTVNLSLTVTADPALGTSRFRVDLKDPDNQTVATVAAGGGVGQQALNNTATSLPGRATLMKTGAYRVLINGNGVNANYKLDATITNPKEIVVNYWFENVTIGRALVPNEPASQPPPQDPARSPPTRAREASDES